MASPKGVRARPTPDMFSAWACTGAFAFTNQNPTHFYYISLYNDSSQGAYLFVHWLMAIAEVASAMLYYSRGGIFGSFSHQCARINPQQPSPPGAIYTIDNGTSQIGDQYINVQSTFTGGALASAAPIHVVPPGYSLIGGTIVADSAPGIAFQYVPMASALGVNPV